MVDGMLEYIFEEPLYGTTCRIRAEFLEDAIRRKVKMKIVIPGKGSGIIDPPSAYKTGKRSTQVFRDPSRPMRLIEVHIPIAGLTLGMSKTEAKKMAKRNEENARVKAQAKLF